MGNICRSPTAEAVFRHLVQAAGFEKEIHIDSAGTHDFHTGDRPMKGLSRPLRGEAMRRMDCGLGKRAKRTSRSFTTFWRWTGRISRYCNESAPQSTAISWACSCSTAKGFRTGIQEVPDPYFGGRQGFEHVLNLVEEAGQGLLNRIQNERQQYFPKSARI